MPAYGCYFLDPQNHIQAAEDIEAERLEEAIARALALLRQRRQHHSVEIWQGALRLYSSREMAGAD